VSDAFESSFAKKPVPVKTSRRKLTRLTRLTSVGGLTLHTGSSSGPSPGASKLPLGLDLSTKHRAYDALGVAVELAVRLVVCDGDDVPVVEELGVPVALLVGVEAAVVVPVCEGDAVEVPVCEGDAVPVADELDVPVPLGVAVLVGVIVDVIVTVGVVVDVGEGVMETVGDAVMAGVPVVVCDADAVPV